MEDKTKTWAEALPPEMQVFKKELDIIIERRSKGEQVKIGDIMVISGKAVDVAIDLENQGKLSDLSRMVVGELAAMSGMAFLAVAEHFGSAELHSKERDPMGFVRQTTKMGIVH